MGEQGRYNVVADKSRAFALRMVNLYRFLVEERNESCLSKQLLRSSTSIGANIAEGIYAESGSDFIHKLAVAQKETSESLYWLDLLHASGFLSETEYVSVHTDCVEIMRLLTSIIKSKKAQSSDKERKQNVNN